MELIRARHLLVNGSEPYGINERMQGPMEWFGTALHEGMDASRWSMHQAQVTFSVPTAF